MKVILSCIHYPMCIAKFFQFALQRREDVHLTTVGPYTGAWIPWNGGMNLPQKYAIPPDIMVPYSPFSGAPIPQNVPIGYIEAQLDFKPDVWLQVDAGFHLAGKPSCPNFIVGTDPHVLNYDKQRSFADKFFCMQTPYQKDGDEYLPYAYDPWVHFPIVKEPEYDVSLIGLHYHERDRIVSGLRAKGVNVLYDLGPVFDGYRDLVTSAPIGLNWSSREDLTARVFELLGMGRLAIVNNVPDLQKFFRRGTDLVTAGTVDEAIDKCIYYLEHQEEMQQIARNGLYAVREETWDRRVVQILNHL